MSLRFWLTTLALVQLLHSSNAFVANKKRQNTIELGRIGAKPEDENEQDYSEMEQYQDPNSRLSAYIRKKARYYHRPTLHAHDCIDIHVSAGLYQVVELDQRNNLATLSAYFDVWWFDKFLPWNATDFDGITLTFVPAKWVWKPEFYLYHSIQGRTPEYAADATAEIRSDGRVRMFIPITSRALCPINVKYFPFDTQNCSFYVSHSPKNQSAYG
ncbi:hypothetical protein QR680_002672 [Steinernema hermaphroditum]|uniref:Neurotransmitter-gated ion-channel ligand-binding domain-containing protein n=1 Tax=Steinernema hermaphroditum TaxID=289476 RepID=A0AA39LI55_9BILA|nr:hypothetical protein QR680_002672 [Steinernema hermaphroditum]